MTTENNNQSITSKPSSTNPSLDYQEEDSSTPALEQIAQQERMWQSRLLATVRKLRNMWIGSRSR